MAQIPVTRANGCDGRVAVHWATKDLTAVSGQDYSGGEGSLVFEHGETAKMIDITIHNDLVRSILLFIYIYIFFFSLLVWFGFRPYLLTVDRLLGLVASVIS